MGSGDEKPTDRNQIPPSVRSEYHWNSFVAAHKGVERLNKSLIAVTMPLSALVLFGRDEISIWNVSAPKLVVVLVFVWLIISILLRITYHVNHATAQIFHIKHDEESLFGSRLTTDFVSNKSFFDPLKEFIGIPTFLFTNICAILFFGIFRFEEETELFRIFIVQQKTVLWYYFNGKSISLFISFITLAISLFLTWIFIFRFYGIKAGAFRSYHIDFMWPISILFVTSPIIFSVILYSYIFIFLDL